MGKKLREILKNLRTLAAFKAIRDNIKEFGFWVWLSREFNTYYWESGKWYWGNPGFLKSLFNYFIGHPFLGWSFSSIAVIGFQLSEMGGLYITLSIVILVELHQFLWGKEASKWFPVDALFDVLTWLLGSFIFMKLHV